MVLPDSSELLVMSDEEFESVWTGNPEAKAELSGMKADIALVGMLTGKGSKAILGEAVEDMQAIVDGKKPPKPGTKPGNLRVILRLIDLGLLSANE